jgi:hypothetical protein
MSLFDQMKTQAQQALELKSTTTKLSSEELAQRNAKLKQIFDYWHEFSELIKVIQPEFMHPIALPAIGEMYGLKLVDTFADYRHAVSGSQNFTDEIDHASLNFFYKAPKQFNFTKEIGYADLVKDVLWRYGLVHTAEDIKNEQARIVEVAFNIPWEVRGSVIVTSLPNSKKLNFVLKNVAKLGDVELEVSYEQVDTVFLDELSKLLLGQKSQFWKLVKF